MRLSEYASTRKTRGSYKLPRSVQQSIPIDRIYADGVWQSGNVFSMMWQISDINYAMQSNFSFDLSAEEYARHYIWML